jgi:molybdenum cofactor biosynthesis enzyme MoaA
MTRNKHKKVKEAEVQSETKTLAEPVSDMRYCPRCQRVRPHLTGDGKHTCCHCGHEREIN